MQRTRTRQCLLPIASEPSSACLTLQQQQQSLSLTSTLNLSSAYLQVEALLDLGERAEQTVRKDHPQHQKLRGSSPSSRRHVETPQPSRGEERNVTCCCSRYSRDRPLAPGWKGKAGLGKVKHSSCRCPVPRSALLLTLECQNAFEYSMKPELPKRHLSLRASYLRRKPDRDCATRKGFPYKVPAAE